MERINQEVKKPISTILFCGENIIQFLDILEMYGFLDYMEYVVLCSISDSELNKAVEYAKSRPTIFESFNRLYFIKKDYDLLPFKDGTFDCVISNCELHFHSHMDSSLKQYNNVLNPDGFLIGSMFGGETLRELRVALNLAENERKGGESIRVVPMRLASEVNNFLQKAEFLLPTLDVHTNIEHFLDPLDLVDYLRRHGDSNCLRLRNPMDKDLLLSMHAIYKHLFSSENVMSKEHSMDASMLEFKGHSGIFATFQYINFIGWKYSEENEVKVDEKGSVDKSFEEWGKEFKDANKDDDNFDIDKDFVFGRLEFEEDRRTAKRLAKQGKELPVDVNKDATKVAKKIIVK